MGIRNLNLRKSQVRKKRDWFLPSSTYTYPPPPPPLFFSLFPPLPQPKLNLIIINLSCLFSPIIT